MSNLKLFISALTMFASLICIQNSALAAGGTEVAPPQKEEPVSPTNPDDQSSWSGDVFVFHSDYSNVRNKIESSSDTPKSCAPDHSRFLINNEDKTTHTLTGVFDSIGSAKLKRFNCLTGTTVREHEVYYLEKSEVEKLPHSRRGWTFGVLILPYKYQTSDKSFGGSTTIGPYLGYRIANFGDVLNGTSTTIVASAGWVNNITVPTAAGVTPAGTINRSGLSTAMGIIFSVEKGSSIQVGILVGQDRLGSNAIAPYAYEGKTWVSAAIGYKFF